MVVTGKEICSLVQRGTCVQLHAGGSPRLLAALLEEGCVCSPSQVESWLLSHSLCLSASSKVVAEFVTQELDWNIHKYLSQLSPNCSKGSLHYIKQGQL